MPRHPRMAEWYRKYIASAQWGKFRSHLIEKRGHLCEDCKRKVRKLTLHHTTYARAGGAERQKDMRLLCGWCHKRAHRTHLIPHISVIYIDNLRDAKASLQLSRMEPTPPYPNLRKRKEQTQ